MRKLLGFSKNDVEACFDSFGWLSDRCAVLRRKIKCDFFPFAGVFLFREGRSLLDGARFFAREIFSRVISFGRSVVFSELSFGETSFLLKRALLVCKGVTFSADVAGNVFVRDKESGRLANPYSPSASRYSLPF